MSGHVVKGSQDREGLKARLSGALLDEAPDSVGRVLARSFWGGGPSGTGARVVELRPRAISRHRGSLGIGGVEA